MKEGRDLAVTLMTSALLLLCVGYLTQCTAPPAGPSPGSGAEAEHEDAATARREAERERSAGKGKSARESEEDEGQEEREKIQRVGRALQTIGANPELRKTLGIPR